MVTDFLFNSKIIVSIMNMVALCVRWDLENKCNLIYYIITLLHDWIWLSWAIHYIIPTVTVGFHNHAQHLVNLVTI